MYPLVKTNGSRNVGAMGGHFLRFCWHYNLFSMSTQVMVVLIIALFECYYAWFWITFYSNLLRLKCPALSATCLFSYRSKTWIGCTTMVFVYIPILNMVNQPLKVKAELSLMSNTRLASFNRNLETNVYQMNQLSLLTIFLHWKVFLPPKCTT